MTERTFCPNCGAPQAALARFCAQCGQGLAGSPPPPQAAPVQPVAPVAPPTAEPAMPTAEPTTPPPAWSLPPAQPQPGYAAPAWSLPPAQPQPGGGASSPYGGPPPVGYPASVRRTIAARPTGITIIAILEVIGGVFGLVAAKALFDYADLRNFYLGDGGTYQLIGLAAAAGAIAAFVVAWGLWSIRPWAWLLGCGLCAVTVGFALLSLANHGDATSAIINIGVSMGVLYYLNTNEVRALFGRSPSTFMQMQTRR